MCLNANGSRLLLIQSQVYQKTIRSKRQPLQMLCDFTAKLKGTMAPGRWCVVSRHRLERGSTSQAFFLCQNLVWSWHQPVSTTVPVPWQSSQMFTSGWLMCFVLPWAAGTFSPIGAALTYWAKMMYLFLPSRLPFTLQFIKQTSLTQHMQNTVHMHIFCCCFNSFPSAGRFHIIHIHSLWRAVCLTGVDRPRFLHL